jgi:Ser/Thr protein kinase RdoA (MazF antagonist)
MVYDTEFLSRLEDGVRQLLPVWNASTGAEVSLLNISENATFRLQDCLSGLDLVIRVHRPDYNSETEILSELAWIDALRRDAVVTTPRPIPAHNGSLLQTFSDGASERHVVAFEYMSGMEPDAGSDLVKWYGALGQITARLHRHSRVWRRPVHFKRKIWDFDRILGANAHWGPWQAALGLTTDGADILQRTHDRLAAQTQAYGEGADRFGLVHCDMRTANLLVDNDRLGVIDFDDCGFSWFAYDFAAAVSFMEHDPLIPDLMAAWVAGYRQEAPLAAEHEAALPMFVMLRRMQLTAWIASHAETPTAQSLGEAYTGGTVELAERYLRSNA